MGRRASRFFPLKPLHCAKDRNLPFRKHSRRLATLQTLKALDNVHLSSREMSVLRKRFEKENGDGLDVPATLLFFGRDETQSTFPESAAPPNTADSQKNEMDMEEELRQKLRQAQEEDERSASDIERKLKSIVLKAESTGTSLAEVFGVFDKDGSGFITAAELEEGLRELLVFETVPKDQVFSLVRKLKKNSGGLAVDTTSSSEKRVLEEEGADGNLLVSAEEFVRFVGGEYEAAEAAQGRLRKVLTLAEEKDGVTLEAAFGALDKNGTGSISVADLEEGLRQLNVFDGMSKDQARLATRRFDHNGDGTVSLPEFLAFVGRPYAANDRPLETKLRRVLLKAESMGVSMEEAFQHFDKDGCGSITAQGFSTGLREMGVFQEFSEEEVDQVTSSFGADGDGAVSLPKFLRFLGKEYGRGGKRSGGGGTGRSLAQRLRLILKKAHELGTPLAASFEGFGADESGRVSAQQLHLALKEIGQFRWTTVGEVKSFVRLLHDDAADTTVTPEGTVPPQSWAIAQDMAPAKEMFLTLPALEAFVEGGDAYLAKKERAALARQQSRDTSSLDHNRLAQTEPTGGKQEFTPSGGENIPCRSISRANSWTAAEGSEPTGEGSAIADGDEKEKELLEQLRMILARVPHGQSTPASGGDGHGVRGHLDSFDVDSDGVLSVDEFIAALRSLGGRGGDFCGRGGVETLVSRFRDGRMSTAGTQNGASVVKIAWWFDGLSKAAHDAVDSDCGIIDKGEANGAHRVGSRGLEEHARGVRKDNAAAGEALRKAVRLAEAKGTTLERTFARLDEDGDGFITLRQLLRGLDQLGVFEQASRDDVLDALDVLDADRRSSRPTKGRQEEESKDGREVNSAGVDLVAFIRLMRQQPIPASAGTGEEKGNEDETSEMKRDEAPYEFSLDPDTKAAEKKLRRVVAKQARLGVDVEGVFRRYDSDQTGSVLRSDFVQAVMQLGIGLLESSASRHPTNFANSTGEADLVRRRQLGQLARAKGPVERRLMRMRQTRRGLFDGGVGGGGERKGDEGNAAAFEEGDESLALIQWYREGQKKSLVRHILATSLTTEYNLFFAFASPLFFEHPLRNPFNHEERFRIDLDDHQLRVVTGTTEWAYLRRNVPPCVGEIGDTPLESEFFDVDPQRGVQVTLMAHEVVFIPFAFLSLEPRRPAPAASTSPGRTRPSGRAGLVGDGGRGDNAAGEGGAGMAERSVAVAFVSASHGHVVSVVQVHLQRRPFAVNRTFRFFQNEGEILKRSIQLLPGGEPGPNLSTRVKTSTRVGEASRDPFAMSAVGSAKYIHCVEEACPDRGDGNAAGGVVIEWTRRAVMESEARGCADVQEVLVKCRVGQFPSQKSFYLLVYNDHFQGSLYETWHIIVQARLRMDVHSLLGQQSPADLVVRGDRYTRKVKAFSSAPAEVSFEPANAFQLVPGAYNRVGVRFRPLSIGSRKIHVHLVDTDSMEIVGAWLATATAMPPVVTKSYEVDLPRDRACHKRIAYANPWSSTRLFRLASSDPKILRPRYESLEVSGGGTGFLRLWFAALEGVSARKEAFLFVNDSEGQNEECLLIRMRGV